MSREVRRVPEGWEHPRNPRGNYVPLFGGTYSLIVAEWERERTQWDHGLKRDYSVRSEVSWRPKDRAESGLGFEEVRPRPKQADYMPEWREQEKTCLQMYEVATEGTPLSPPMRTAEQLARWLADNNAPAFGVVPATFEEWLVIIKQDRATIGAAIGADGVVSGAALDAAAANAKWRTAFPDFGEMDVTLPAGFVDASWRNEPCPRFINEGLCLSILVDYADLMKREHADGKRFTLVRLDKDGMVVDTGDDVVRESDDWSQIVEAVATAQKAVIDIRSEVVKLAAKRVLPTAIASFAELDDLCDTAFAGALAEEPHPLRGLELYADQGPMLDAIQESVDRWLCAEGLARALTLAPSVGRPTGGRRPRP